MSCQELQVDGDLLLNITEENLINDLAMTSGITRKRLVFIQTYTLQLCVKDH